jgi:PKD repeat protein
MKIKQTIGIMLISVLLLSAVALAAPATPANKTATTTAKPTPLPVTKLIAAFKSTHNAKTPLAVKFTDKSTGSPTKWSWNFGDMSPIVKTKNAIHTYKKAGKYTVKLTVTNAKGQISTASKKLILP